MAKAAFTAGFTGQGKNGKQENGGKDGAVKGLFPRNGNGKGLMKSLLPEMGREGIQKDFCITSVQNTVAVKAVHEKFGLIESYNGMFVKSYRLGEINYLTASEEEQEVLLTRWRGILNSIGNNCEFAITFFNRSVDMELFREETLKKETGDRFDYLRRELNQIITDRIMEGKNGIRKDKYITIGVHTENVQKAGAAFRRLDTEIEKALKKIGSSAVVIPIDERLANLHDIYNPDAEGEFLIKTRISSDNGEIHEVSSFDFENIRSMGLSVNDVIAPSFIGFGKDAIELGNRYARVLQVTEYPNILTDEFLHDLTDMPFNMLTTLNIKPIPAAETNRIVGKNILLIREEKLKLQRRAREYNASEDMISPEVLDREQEALALRAEIRENDEHLFETTLTMVVFAENPEQLQEYTDRVLTECRKVSVSCSVMVGQQEEGFNTTLPLCYNELRKRRTLKSTSVAVLHPFSILELNEKDGINYSMNAVTKNLIVLNRLSKPNFNSFIIGTPGSGKSFKAKEEIINVLLGSNGDVVVIDPEGEYGALAALLGGQVIRITPGGANHVNPLDVESGYEMEDETDPVLAKADFILKMLETIIRTPFGLNSVQETIVDECVHALFAPFERGGRLGNAPREQMPTLTDLQRMLAKREEPEARELAIALRLYSGKGSLNVFGMHTNVDTGNRFLVYDIRDVGEKMKEMAMLIILDSIQNKLFRNRRIGKNTWIYVDEFHLLMQNENTAQFLKSLWKRARKYGGVPTGMTQNISELLESQTASKMISNCNFVQILNLMANERAQVQALLNLSDSVMDFVTNAPRGQGIIYTGTSAVPFYAAFPKENDIYRAITSDMKEIMAYKEQETRERMKARKG